MRFYFQKSFPEIALISARHSLKKRENFNLFFSDIDTTFVLSSESSFAPVISHFDRFKKIFPMFDMPEFYTQKEYEILQLVSKPEIEPYLSVIWNLRKLNWIKKYKTHDRYEQLKMQRAFHKSFVLVFSCEHRAEEIYALREMNFFKDLLSGFKKRQVCLYSFFIGTASTESLHLQSSADDYIKFNSLLAGEELEDFGSDDLNKKTRVIKYAIEAREQLIANNSLRVASALGKNPDEFLKWKSFLDGRNSMSLLESELRIS